MALDYKPITKEEFLEIAKKTDIVVLTATDTETKCLHENMTVYDNAILKSGIDVYTYYAGILGNYNVIHVQCKPGTGTFGGSTITTAHAISLVRPKAIIMIGIAFGIDKKKQKVGDVLISESLWPYDIKRVGKAIIHRGGNPRASTFLLNRFEKHNWNYKYSIGNAKKVLTSRAHPGIIFSGEKLIDDIEFRDQLKKEDPEAVGGEMEGGGVAAAAEGSKTDWIVVKAICDFADGDKKRNKAAKQFAAATAAVIYCKQVFLEEHIFSEIGIRTTLSKTSLTIPDAQLVLFKRYTPEAEQYYFERAIDVWFNGFISQYSIWLYGESGCGKSTVIMRNLILQNRQVIQICLASGTEYGIVSVLNEILAKLHVHFNKIFESQNGKSQDELINSVADFLIKNFDFKNQIIYIDEIPEFNDDSIISNIFHCIYAINSKIYNTVPDAKMVFVLSSIACPITKIHSSQLKILENFKFENLKLWSNEEITALIAKIMSSLQTSFTTLELSQIAEVANGSPRIVKRIIRDFLATKGNIDLQRILTDIKLQV